MMDEIPHIIHYCWFGRGKKNKVILKCIKTWKEHLPEFKIIEWNEDNFCIEDAPLYVRQAYEKKKYAFVSDYVRLIAMEKMGGIYFDTDIEVRKDFSSLLAGRKAVVGFQDDTHLMTGFFACVKNLDFIKMFIDCYNEMVFINEDGSFNYTANPTKFTELLVELKGLNKNGKYQEIKDDIVAYPIQFFSAFDLNNDIEISNDDTYTVHHYTGTWNDATKKKKKIKRKLVKILGSSNYVKLKKFYKSHIKK